MHIDFILISGNNLLAFAKIPCGLPLGWQAFSKGYDPAWWQSVRAVGQRTKVRWFPPL